MKHQILTALLAAATIHSAHASVVISTSTAAPFTPSTGDLIHGLTPFNSSGDFQREASTGTSVLTDGLHATFSSANHDGIATGGQLGGTSVVYQFAASDVLGVNVYGGWVDGGRNEQNFSLEFSTDGGATYGPAINSGAFNPDGNDIRTSITDNTGNLANGVNAIRVNFLTVENGFTGYTEIDVIAATNLYTISQDDSVFISGIGSGAVSVLTGVTSAIVPSTFALVAGTGDTDNGKFTIFGNEIRAGAHNFLADANNTQYFIRVEGTGDASEGTDTKEFVLTLFNDDDADGLLDNWELSFAPNLTDLNGRSSGSGQGAGTGDFDGDGISDSAEYNLVQYPGISPILADTDSDGLDDSEEISPQSPRPATNPVIADTDDDGLNDGVESNSGIFVNASDTGTNATTIDTDGDGARDGFEVQKSSTPTDYDSRPALPSGFALVPVTDDASTGISTTTTYTHKVSGGSAASINGVTLDSFDGSSTSIPLNFAWSVGVDVITGSNGGWKPANFGISSPSGDGLLAMFGGFTYNSNGGNAGQSQTCTLSGLTIGRTYTLKIFIRPWAPTTETGRPIDLEFTNGTTVETPFGALLEDRPGIVLNNGNVDSAYYISYTYVAKANKLVFKASVPTTGSTGSFHFYGLTNEVASAPTGNLAIIGFSRDPDSGDFIIDFTGEPNTTYDVTKSPDLDTAFGPLEDPLTADTNSAGIGQATIPSAEASESKEFYRIEK